LPQHIIEGTNLGSELPEVRKLSEKPREELGLLLGAVNDSTSMSALPMRIMDIIFV